MKKQSELEKIGGWHSVDALLEKRSEAIERLCLQAGREDKRAQALLAKAKRLGVTVQTLTREAMAREAGELRHQGVLAWALPTVAGNQNDLDMLLDGLRKPPFLLILDGVEDPRNLGACLRSADAAGVDGVIIPRDRAASLSPAARKAAAGAAESVPLFAVSNLARCLRQLRDAGIWLVGLAGEGEGDLYQARLTGPLAIVMGAEGKGLRRLTREHCDELIRIPMLGTVESLNVSAAASVCLFEAVRQRQP
ncbi:MAG: 23S rRNA (guanosine(2251)-2'-O)-methyltransferase RlmB [Salinisphaeraceae bacterium]|nr:23S rRNA (guanosine(2251)-2'-O)-methyltransferase RlmB [Salinisphaeraceae bacterium]